jgi:hypothetical protein
VVLVKVKEDSSAANGSIRRLFMLRRLLKSIAVRMALLESARRLLFHQESPPRRPPSLATTRACRNRRTMTPHA